jgi:hypothetical protein
MRLDWGGAALADLRHNWKGKVRRFRIHMFAFGLFLLALVQAIDPWALQALLPDRWGSAVFIALGVVAWLLRKVTDHPVLVSTTYYGETADTVAPDKPDPTVDGPHLGGTP